MAEGETDGSFFSCGPVYVLVPGCTVVARPGLFLIYRWRYDGNSGWLDHVLRLQFTWYLHVGHVQQVGLSSANTCLRGERGKCLPATANWLHQLNYEALPRWEVRQHHHQTHNLPGLMFTLSIDERDNALKYFFALHKCPHMCSHVQFNWNVHYIRLIH